VATSTARLKVVCVAGRDGGIPPEEAAFIARTFAAEPDVEVEIFDPQWRPGRDARIDCLVASIRYGGLGELPDGVTWVQLWGTGIEGTPAALYGSRIVTCGRGTTAGPIAEFVLASMLAVEKKFPGVWLSSPAPAGSPVELGTLAGKRLAVVGLGTIGSRVAQLGLAFGMTVTALRSGGRPSGMAGVESARDAGELVEGAGHVVVAAPATPATRHLLGHDAFVRMGPGAHLVNVSRGSLIDHDELRLALDRGQVGWASLDVVEPEPLPPGHWIYSHPRVHLSPHVSWNAPGSHHHVAEFCAANIWARLSGAPLAGLVDFAAGY
jgi:phosphoglycerate dehydrogenase-like enzyme